MKKIFLAALFFCGFTLLAVSLTLAATQQSRAPQSIGFMYQATSAPIPTPTSAMPDMLDRLAPPPTVYPPTQADRGQQTYYLVCMTCHGDRGQGLTDEFRALIGPTDSNCWQTHCHGSNHPRDGFVFPHVVPPVIGDVMKERFVTALQLHDFIAKNMPYQAPGSLTPSDYWNLTAYLLRANGVELKVAFLDEQTAGRILLAKPAPQSSQETVSLPVVIILGIGLVLLLVICIRIFQHR